MGDPKGPEYAGLGLCRYYDYNPTFCGARCRQAMLIVRHGSYRRWEAYEYSRYNDQQQSTQEIN